MMHATGRITDEALRGITDENVSVCLHGSDSAQTPGGTAAISTSPWAAALVACACVPHSACQAVKMLSNTTLSSCCARATRRGTVSKGSQQHFALFYGHSTFEPLAENHGQACSGTSMPWRARQSAGTVTADMAPWWFTGKCDGQWAGHRDAAWLPPTGSESGPAPARRHK